MKETSRAVTPLPTHVSSSSSSSFRHGAASVAAGKVHITNACRRRSIARRALAPYDQPRFERTSRIRRDVKVPPKTAFATTSATWSASCARRAERRR